MGSVLDVTACKKAEQDLQKSYSLLESIMESVGDGILVVNEQGKANWLRKNPDETGTDVLTTTDGRTYEWHARPHMIGHEILGRVWFFRDITAQNKAKQDLLLPNASIASSYDTVVVTNREGAIE